MGFSLTEIARLPEPIGFFKYLPSFVVVVVAAAAIVAVVAPAHTYNFG